MECICKDAVFFKKYKNCQYSFFDNFYSNNTFLLIIFVFLQ